VAYSPLPETGKPWLEIAAYLDGIKAKDPDLLHGAMSCHSMKGDEPMQQVLQDSYLSFFHHNGVARRMMPGVCELEDELLSMCAGILSGGAPGVVANITSGGTESIFCAIHAMRQWARAQRSDIGPFEIVAPMSAHPAFSKACHYLGIKLVRTPLTGEFRADVDAMTAAVTERTIGLIGSAPCWPYGLYDPIDRLSQLAEERDLWLHVDACVGGYLTPFQTLAGHPPPTICDFRLNGVKSMSADLHKYAYAAKPASTVAWKAEELLQYHHYSASDWTGTPYKTQAFTGSRPVAAVAAAYAILNFVGEAGFVRMARLAFEHKERLLRGVARLGLKPWKSETILAYYTSDDPELPVEQIVGGLRELGWASFGTPNPPLIQLAVSPFPEDGSVIDAYLSDLERVVTLLRSGKQIVAGELKYAD